jgi:hypothetical protein
LSRGVAWVFLPCGAGADGGVIRSSWLRGALARTVGVKVERPQPEARTNDLDATVGRRMLVSDDRRAGRPVASVVVDPSIGRVFASGPSRGGGG